MAPDTHRSRSVHPLAVRRASIRWIAHRGFAAEAPENTVAALRRAAGLADGVEFDVRRCGSGELVVIHDRRVDRVTDGEGRVADLALEDLRALRVLGTDQRVPTLAEVLEALPPETALHVDLKEVGVATDAVAALKAHDGDVTFASFHPAALARVRGAAPTAPTAYTADDLRDRPIATARRLGCRGVHLSYQLCLLPGLVALAHRRNLSVNGWTVSRPELAWLLGLTGVDGVSVDGRHAVPGTIAARK